MNTARFANWDEVAIFVRLRWRAKEWFLWNAYEQENGEVLFVWEDCPEEAPWQRSTRASEPGMA
jgi:hypothetical protein